MSEHRTAKKEKLKSNSIDFHARHTEDLPRLNRVKGQLNGIEKMILDGRYCPDILTQIRAVHNALKSIEASVLKRHLNHCVKSAMTSKNQKIIDEKIEEITRLVTGNLK